MIDLSLIPGCRWVNGLDSVMPNPSLNSMTFGATFSLKLSIRAGPNGAAPPVTNVTKTSKKYFKASVYKIT